VRDHLGFWSIEWPDDSSRIVTLWEGINQKLAKGSTVVYAKGCNTNDMDTSGFAEAKRVALQSDVVVLTVGEERNMSGESKSRSSLRLPGVQELLIKAMVATGKPVVLLIHAGRPLVFNWAADHVPSVLYAWWLGTEAGNAMADVLFGDYNPSGKLPMTFPRNEGQIPIYYNHFNTGRPPATDSSNIYVSAYIDLPNSPRYPFGFGLSYTSFSYESVMLSDTLLKGNQELTVKVRVKNTGNYAGKETVQLYLRDRVGKVVRPVKELKKFEQIFLQPGETKEVVFTLTTSDLAFYDNDLRYDWEEGAFDVMVGGNARDVQMRSFYWGR
jgi:beta-glucosidase